MAPGAAVAPPRRDARLDDGETATPQLYRVDTSFRDPSGNDIRLTQVMEFSPHRH